MKGQIKESRTAEINKIAIIKASFSSGRLNKIQLLTKNDSTKRVKYKVLESTDLSDYEVDRIQDDRDTPKTYELTEHNLKIFEDMKIVSGEIKKLENKRSTLSAQII